MKIVVQVLPHVRKRNTLEGSLLFAQRKHIAFAEISGFKKLRNPPYMGGTRQNLTKAEPEGHFKCYAVGSTPSLVGG